MVEKIDGFRIRDEIMIIPADEVLPGWRIKYYTVRQKEKYPPSEWIKVPDVFASKDECMTHLRHLIANNPNFQKLVVIFYERGIQHRIIDEFREET